MYMDRIWIIIKKSSSSSLLTNKAHAHERRTQKVRQKPLFNIYWEGIRRNDRLTEVITKCLAILVKRERKEPSTESII